MFHAPETLIDGARRASDLHRELRPEAVRRDLEVLVEHDILVAPDARLYEKLWTRVPVKAKWRLALHTADSIKLVLGRNTAEPPRVSTIDGFAAQLWAGIDGEHSLAEIVAALVTDPESVRARASRLVAQWVHSDVQLLRVSETGLGFFKNRPRPPYLGSSMPFPRLGEQEPDGVDLAAYHQEVIGDPMRQFEEVETTLSHLFREPRDALAGLTWGARFIQRGLELGHVHQSIARASTVSVVEVGGGLGYFAEAALEELARIRGGLEGMKYTIVDLSPSLHAAQTARLSRFGESAATVLGDGIELAMVESRSVDLLLSNEVIADFPCVTLLRSAIDIDDFDPAELEAALDALEDDDDESTEITGDPEALALINRLGLELLGPPGPVLFNLGALRFVETLARVLAPGGSAIVTEFGDRYRRPRELTHLDHAEVSIHFGHLIDAARNLGLDAELIDVPLLMDLDPEAEVLRSTRTWFRNLRWLAAQVGIDLPKLAYTREGLRQRFGDALDISQLEGLDDAFGPLSERIHGLVPSHFKALCLRKPTSA